MIKILEYGKIPADKIFERQEYIGNVSDAVAEIIDNVRKNGDGAVIEYTERFDKVSLQSLEVTETEIEEAFEAVDKEFLEILREAAANIRAFHQKQVRNSFIISESKGIVMGQKVTPIEKVGLYVPGGTAAYPSTVLMDSIPAFIAGCPQIVMTTPPGKDGKVNPVILAAAKIAGVNRIFKTGGAQAIAALAYGTETIPKVDKIVGPGNAFVAEAKKQVYGQVSIDMIAGPSEILIIADGNSVPAHAAADLLSQAEHDVNASAVLVTDSMELALKVQAEIEKQLETLPRYEIARRSVDNNGKIIVTESLEDAIAVSNEIAPEHLELMVDNPFDILDRVTNAGSI
ncbi:MAG: histidinol dehydrogenase, partial [Clostridia bacterium]|nr:histidinol dehydrogenase [Clostridia bacterium]